jgi:uroporphyrinogen III methyltransferase/synthase
MRRPQVFLIGAGPGDPGLITARGLECLRRADVVLHDTLVHQRLLRHARPGAEVIDVGTAAPQAMAQEAICYLLAEKAREGKVVARLK